MYLNCSYIINRFTNVFLIITNVLPLSNKTINFECNCKKYSFLRHFILFMTHPALCPVRSHRYIVIAYSKYCGTISHFCINMFSMHTH